MRSFPADLGHSEDAIASVPQPDKLFAVLANGHQMSGKTMMAARLFLLTALAVGPVGAAHAQSQNGRALEVCATTALRQLLIVQRIVNQQNIIDRRGYVSGTQVRIDVNALGKKTQVICIYDAAKGTAIIEAARPRPDGPAPSGVNPTQAVAACRTAAKQQRLMVDTVASQSDIRNGRGQTVGRKIILNVFQAGRPAQVHCDYDYATRFAALELRRPQAR